jgi:hypothetical protein
MLKKQIIICMLVGAILLPELSSDLHFIFFHKSHIRVAEVGISESHEHNDAICPYLNVKFFPVDSVYLHIYRTYLERGIAYYKTLKTLNLLLQKRFTFLLRGPPS